jgi:hypothetical protein
MKGSLLFCDKLKTNLMVLFEISYLFINTLHRLDFYLLL